MSLAKFRHKYPQGSLVSELIEIDRGTYIVKALIQIDNVILSTGLAGAATVETAEDAARARAIATLFLDEPSSNITVSDSVPSQVRANSTPATSVPTPNEARPKDNVNFSKPQPQVIKSEQALTPVTVPLKPVAETVESESQAMPINEPEPTSANNLFGDTFNAETPTLTLLEEDNSSSKVKEPSPVSQELEAMDFNEIKQKTDIEIKRLSWTKEQGKDFLMSRYGKRSRLHLTDEQLLEFLRYLETLPNPVK